MSKHQELVTSISTATLAILKPLFEGATAQTGTEFAHVNTLLAAILARLEVLEKGAAASPAKRAPRGERRVGGGGAAAAASDDPYEKVKNAMLFSRRKWTEDEWRRRFLTAAVQAEIDADDKTTKHAEGTVERWLAEGGLFWRKCATVQQKKDIRDEFNRWKEDRDRAALATPLAADAGAAGAAEAAPSEEGGDDDDLV